jgi:acetyl esterase/lipase
MINGVLRAARGAGIHKKVDRALGGRDALDPMLERARRFDHVVPPKRIRRRWHHEVLSAAGSPLHLLRQRIGGAAQALLYLHGGGYMIGPAREHWRTAARLAGGGEADFAMLIYPKAPEHDHEDGIEAALAAYGLIVERYGSENVVVVGDSAGGGLALSLLMTLRERGIPQPHAAVLISPWLDLAMSDPASEAQAASDLMLTIDGAVAAGRYWSGELDPTDPLVSPRHASTTGFAPLHVFVGSEELFLPDCRAFVEKARANGDEATLRVMRRGQHVAAIFSTPEGRIARAQMLALIDWP